MACGYSAFAVSADESIDYGRLGNCIDTLIAAGVNGIYSNGAAGEFYNQTEAEFDPVSVILAGANLAVFTPYY